MDIDRLRYFCTIAQTGSLTEASELLHISQPALSKAMKLLEDEMGTRLLLPMGRGITITDRGRQIAQQAQKILKDLQDLREDSLAQKPTSKKMSIASFEVFTTYFLGKLVAKNFPEMEMHIHELIPGEMEEAIANGTSDLGITYLPIPHPDLETIKVSSIGMGIYSANNKFKNTDFADWPFAVPVHPIQGVPTKVKGLDGWPEDRLVRKIKYRVGMMETALELCRQGAAVAYLPQFVVKLHNTNVRAECALKELPEPSQLRQKNQSVYIVKRKSTIEDKNFRAVAKALRELS